MHEPRQPRIATVAAVVASIVLVAGCSGSATSSAPGASAAAATTGPSAAAPSPSAEASAAPSAPVSPASTPVPSDGQTAGETRTDGHGITQVWVPAGKFSMGTDEAAITKLKAAGPPDWVAGLVVSTDGGGA